MLSDVTNNTEQPVDEAICITEGCGEQRRWKGLCGSCYGVAKNLILKKMTTWDELMDMGLCVQDKKPFRVAFDKKKAEFNKGLVDNGRHT